MLPCFAAACPFINAEYIPDPKDYRTRTNYYQYKITVTPDLHLVLNLIDPAAKSVVTQLRMQYSANTDADPAAVAWLSKNENMEVEFFTKDLQRVPVDTGADAAPDMMILRDSHAKFLTLDDKDLDIRYFNNQRVKPGANVHDRLELVPDVWVLDKCWH